MKVDQINPVARVQKIEDFKGTGLQTSKGAKNLQDSKDRHIPVEQKLSSQRSIGEKAWIEMVERANKALQGVDKRFEFSIHEDTHQIMVKVVNNENNEIIREIPPEKILDLISKIWELAGIFVDEKR